MYTQRFILKADLLFKNLKITEQNLIRNKFVIDNICPEFELSFELK